MDVPHCLSFPWAGFISWPSRSISKDLSLANHTLPTYLQSGLQEIAQSPLKGTTQLVDMEEEGCSPTIDGQWLKKRPELVLN